MKVLGLVAVAVMAFWLSVSQVLAADKSFVVGVEELDYYPVYGLVDGEYVGAAREILSSFAEDKGYTLTFRPLPIKRLYAELLSGGIDFKFPDHPQWNVDGKRGTKLAYSHPVIRYVDGVLVAPERLGKGAEAVRTLGTVSGFTPYAWGARIKDGRLQVKENPRMEALLRQVMLERLDGAYASVAVANYILGHQLAMPGALVFDPKLPHSRDAYLLSSLKQPEVIAEFNVWLEANAAKVQAIKDRLGAEKGLD